MSHTMTLQIPEDVYQPLAQTAKRTGRTPEDLAAQWLVNAIRLSADDPMEKFIGAFPTNVTDWADEHDKYIRQNLINEINNSKITDHA